ncbi:MAG: BRO family protein [Desulfovibrionaceae bacterium]|nr:BRO family protein [Desulfovibrionaceae bacterium]
MSQSIALSFNDFTFSPVTRANQPWFRSSELARALGYAREDKVARLYQRNAEEFTENMTQVVEIVDNKVRIFSLRGCHLIAMFARTPVAKQFRRWVLDV